MRSRKPDRALDASVSYVVLVNRRHSSSCVHSGASKANLMLLKA